MLSLTSLTVACILGVASVSPFVRQSDTCNPNFEGAGVSIIADDSEWDVSPVVVGTALKKEGGIFPPDSTAKWYVEQTGSADPQPTSSSRAINQNDLIVDVVNGKLTLEETDSSKQDATP
ncbi:hypothetical protein B0H17DRAFT_1283921 [Mycena rosella]|uniref:Uncharacterized protein n=1 Tax=Mycena rosella TaxID=1033263 RepID=A0AAD7BTX2_MYCRO|nr:hypothetical protein B0H17DRAFT_1283921 [Mycena rosella]